MYPYNNVDAESLANSTFTLKEGDDTKVIVTTSIDGAVYIPPAVLKSDLQMQVLSAITRTQSDIVTAQATVTAKTATLAKLNTASTTINAL